VVALCQKKGGTGQGGKGREREGGEEGKGMRSLYKKLQFELDDFSAQVVLLC